MAGARDGEATNRRPHRAATTYRLQAVISVKRHKLIALPKQRGRAGTANVPRSREKHRLVGSKGETNMWVL
jgi:hypothetical protein